MNHIGFDAVHGEDGERFKTSNGDAVKLVDSLDEDKIFMDKQLQEQLEENKANVKQDEVDKTAITLE